ncbi:lysine exporter LysO family protein [Mycoplasmatota bacterium]|nr:lysine exporter LysO family protein [Mycoplasmatota bacterium]
MTLYIFITVFLGIIISYFFLPSNYIKDIDLLIDIILIITLFFIGIGIGQNKHIFKELKKAGMKVLVLPIGTIIGSLIGGALAGYILQRTLTLSLAIASGFGWYSISAGLLENSAGLEVATIGFLSNVIREMMAFLLIPFIAKKLSPYVAISVGGATSMDTTLPLVSRSASEEFVLISFIHGFLLSLLVPVLVQFFANI